MSGRSAAWFGAEGRSGMIHRSWMRNQGEADQGADLDFLVGRRGAEVPRESH